MAIITAKYRRRNEPKVITAYISFGTFSINDRDSYLKVLVIFWL